MRWFFCLILTLLCSAPPAGADHFQPRHLSVDRLVHWLADKYPQLRFVADGDGFEVSGDSPGMKALAADLQRLDVDDAVGEWVEINLSIPSWSSAGSSTIHPSWNAGW